MTLLLIISCMFYFADGLNNLSLEIIQNILSSVPMNISANESPQRLLRQTSDLLSQQISQIRTLEAIIYTLYKGQQVTSRIEN